MGQTIAGLNDKTISYRDCDMSISVISSGHFYLLWINLTACHTSKIKATARAAANYYFYC